MTERRTAVITGATRGIGRATAIALGKRGYDVAIIGRTEHEGDVALRPEAEFVTELKIVSGSLDSTAEAIEAAGGRAFPYALDLLDRDGIERMAVDAIDSMGHVDVLLNNAIYIGSHERARFLDTPTQEIEKRVFVNLTAALLVTQPILRHMVARGRGLIASTTSAGAYIPPPGPIGEGGWALLYGVSKAGMHRIVEQLVVEHAKDGIRTLNLQPGAVAIERVLIGNSFIADRAAPVDAIGEAFARILDAPPDTYPNGGNLDVQQLAREWGLLAPRDGQGAR